MIRILLLATIIPIYAIYEIYKLIDSYRFGKIQEQYFVEKCEMQKAEYKKMDSDSTTIYGSNSNWHKRMSKNYRKQDFVMTYNELKLYQEMRKITDKKGWEIFPRVALYSIVSVNKEKDFQKLFPNLKGRTVDFVICDEKNLYKVVMCIEIEGSIHNKPFKEYNDKFKDDLFKEVGIKFVRIKRQDSYNYKELYNELGIEDDEEVEKAKEEEEKSYFSTKKKNSKDSTNG